MSSKKITNDTDSIVERLWELAGGRGRGNITRFAETLGVLPNRLNQYLNGRRKPGGDFYQLLYKKLGVNINWLLTGEGPKYQGRLPVPRSIPILGSIPAGPPGGEAWTEYDAQDLLEIVVDASDPYLIALRVDGLSMWPTLFDLDLVVMSSQSQWGNGDIVVAEVRGVAEDYVVKRLGKETRQEVTLISDNLLHFPIETFNRELVEIRGRVIRVVRWPSRRSPHRDGPPELIEFYQSPRMQELLADLASLEETVLQAAIEQVRALKKIDLRRDTS